METGGGGRLWKVGMDSGWVAYRCLKRGIYRGGRGSLWEGHIDVYNRVDSGREG